MLERREELYNDLRSRGFYFEDDKIFDAFLIKVEELSKQYNTPEMNYYHAFEQKLKKIEDKKGFPAVGAIIINVTYTEKGPKQYKISEIKVSQSKVLKEHENSRY